MFVKSSEFVLLEKHSSCSVANHRHHEPLAEGCHVLLCCEQILLGCRNDEGPVHSWWSCVYHHNFMQHMGQPWCFLLCNKPGNGTVLHLCLPTARIDFQSAGNCFSQELSALVHCRMPWASPGVCRHWGQSLWSTWHVARLSFISWAEIEDTDLQVKGAVSY